MKYFKGIFCNNKFKMNEETKNKVVKNKSIHDDHK